MKQCRIFFNELDHEYELDGEYFTQLFLLVDGIYPTLTRFLKSIPVPLTRIDRVFAGWQESTRKDIERAFGVMKKKFHFLVHSVMMHEREDIFYCVKAFIALHNIMVEVRVNEGVEEDDAGLLGEHLHLDLDIE